MNMPIARELNVKTIQLTEIIPVFEITAIILQCNVNVQTQRCLQTNHGSICCANKHLTANVDPKTSRQGEN